MFAGRPVIGVSTGFTDYGDYLGLAFTRPLTRLGALPVIVPYLEEAEARTALLAEVDGLVLGVGRDLEPHRFGGQPHPSSTAHSPHRDQAELSVARAAIDQGVPLLGVCRGMQIINVALGGTLYHDHSALPPPADRHPGGDWNRWAEVVQATLEGDPPPAHPTHPIDVAPDSLIAIVLGQRALVNSYHHQSLDRLGAGVVVTARAPDGVIEAIEVPHAPALCVGVQWELQEGWQRADDNLQVFALLVEAAREHRNTTVALPGDDRHFAP